MHAYAYAHLLTRRGVWPVDAIPVRLAASRRPCRSSHRLSGGLRWPLYHPRLRAGLTEPPAISRRRNLMRHSTSCNIEDRGSLGTTIVHVSIVSSEAVVPILPDASKYVSLKYTKMNSYNFHCKQCRDESN
jgi:hypothetical protein